MEVQNRRTSCPFAVVCLRASLLSICALTALVFGATAQAGQNATPQKTPPAVGTIKAISADSLTLATDSGSEVKVQLTPDVKVVRVPPGSKDLKESVPIQLSDLQPGDRILVRPKTGQDASSFVAGMIVAMKKADIAEKQQKEKEEWQRHGIGGLVSSVDAAQNTVTIKTLSAAGAKEVAIHAGKNTVLRRYTPGSVNFDEATVAAITQIQAGDQLRARGTRSADGGEFAADEIVSGSFKNISGVVTAVNATAGTLILNDLVTKKPVELKVTAESQMKKLPDRMAQGIAMRLKGMGAAANGGGPRAGQPGTPSSATPPQGQQGQGQVQGQASGAAAQGGSPRGAGDFQQMLSRLPASTLSDFQKGEAVMVVATSSQGDGPSTVITLLGGVESILQASSDGASILSPWSLSQGGGGDMGNP